MILGYKQLVVWSAPAVMSNGQMLGWDLKDLRKPTTAELESPAFRSGKVVDGRAQYIEERDWTPQARNDYVFRHRPVGLKASGGEGKPCCISDPSTDFCETHSQQMGQCLQMGLPSAGRASGGGGSGGYVTGPDPAWVDAIIGRIADSVVDLNNASPRLPTKAELEARIKHIVQAPV